MADPFENKIKPDWLTKALGSASLKPDEKIDESILDEEAVILLQGNNLFGDRIYSYLKLTMRNFTKLSLAMARHEEFVPSDFGEVVAAGRGEPTQELQDEMRVKYNLVTIPKPKAAGPAPMGFSQPKFFDDEE